MKFEVGDILTFQTNRYIVTRVVAQPQENNFGAIGYSPDFLIGYMVANNEEAKEIECMNNYLALEILKPLDLYEE